MRQAPAPADRGGALLTCIYPQAPQLVTCRYPRGCESDRVPVAQEHVAPGEALSRFIRAFPSLRVSATSGSSPFQIDYQQIATARFTINRLRCSGRLRAVGPLPDAVAVGRREAGLVAITGGGRTVDTSRPYLRPLGPAELEVSDGAVMLVALQPVSVAEYMERSGERAAIRRPTATTPHLAAWGLVMDHAATFLDHPDALDPQATEELHDLLCWSLLHAFEDPWLETRRRGARSAVLRRALEYMEQHADGPVLMPSVAEAATVSVRALALLFRRELGMTPLRWLHELRLDRARLDLLTGDGTVAEIAARHGMPHSGRFAAQYRARFGEHPATTLRSTFPEPTDR